MSCFLQPAPDQGEALKSNSKTEGTCSGGQARTEVSLWGQETPWSRCLLEQGPGGPWGWQTGPKCASGLRVAEGRRRLQPGPGGACRRMD